MEHQTTSGAGGKTIAGFLPRTVLFSDEGTRDFFVFSEMMRERDRLWTLGPISSLAFALPPVDDNFVLMRFDVAAFVWEKALPRQTVEVRLGEKSLANWSFADRTITRRAIALRREDIPDSRIVVLNFLTPHCMKPKDLGINGDERSLGVAILRVAWEPQRDIEKATALAQLYGRRVGTEARKSFDDKLDSGFWSRFITGPNVLDVGFKGYEEGIVPIVDGAIGIDLDYPGYDGTKLPFEDESQDTVFSSHCLEHIPNYLQVIQDWFRVTKVGGHIITVVPNAMLYERKLRPPSRWAKWSHQRFYTPQTLLGEFERALRPNTFRVSHMAENDARYRYDLPTERHPDGCYEIELVIQKIPEPTWKLDD